MSLSEPWTRLNVSSEDKEADVFYLQRDSETDLLGVVTEDAPRRVEEDKTDLLLRLKDLFL